MSRTISCVQCGVTLNMPAQAAGRRLKCPKCGIKFQAPAADPNAGSAAVPLADVGSPESTFELSRKSSHADLPVMPTAAGDLRETFDLSMMTEAAGTSGKASKSASGHQTAADALALFQEPSTKPRRKKSAEARASARRCPQCGGVVAMGMSICQTCGLDLETGARVDLDDDLIPHSPTRPSGIPLPLAIIGCVCAALSLAGGVASLLSWEKGGPYFGVVALFGVYASVQFLRLKSARLLLTALSLGALISAAFLIVAPIYEATNSLTEVQLNDRPDDPNSETTEFRNGQLDTQKVGMGIALLFLYAVVSVYLLSPQAQKSFRK